MGEENFGYRVGEHPEDDDFSDVLDNFDKIPGGDKESDVWHTNRGRGKKDKSRIWGTEEYFKRVERPRDEWDTGLEDFSSMRRRIQRNIELDAEKIRADARRAAARVREKTAQRLAQTRLQAQKEILKDYDFTAKTKTKPKRRWKVSGKGITLGGSIFWMFLIYTCFFDDDDKDTKAKVTDTKTSNDVVETAKKTYNNLKPEVQALVDKAKDEYERVIVKKDQKSTTVVNDSDPYKQNDDRYGSVDDKW